MKVTALLLATGLIVSTVGNPDVTNDFEVRSVAPPGHSDRYFGSQFLMFVGSSQTVGLGLAQNDKIALYAATRRDQDRPDDIWAANLLTDTFTGADSSNVIGLEIDVNNHDKDMPFHNTRLMDGLWVNSGLSRKAHTAIGVGVIQKGAEWQRGMQIKRGAIDNHGLGLQVGDFAKQGAAAAFDQWNNGGDAIVVRRASDTNPHGDAFRLVNQADNNTLFLINANGDMVFQGALGQVLTVTGDVYKNGVGVYAKLAQLEARIARLERANGATGQNTNNHR
jgi:hypothetical protein